MIPVLDTDAYIEHLLALPRPKEEAILAFYEHRMGVICHNPRLMLLPLDDHLAHRGDGVFESILFRHSKLYELDQHLDRMTHSAAGMHLKPPCSQSELRAIVLAVAKAANTPDGMLRILVGRGPGGFGIDPFESPVSSLYVVAYHFEPRSEAWYAKGLTAFRTSIPAKQGYLARIKNTNYVPNMLMVHEARVRGVDVPICFDAHGNLAESAIANICMVDNAGALVVPEFSNALAGTTVLRAVELLQGSMSIEHRKIPEGEIFTAKELLLLGTSSLCAGIVQYEGKMIADGVPGSVAKTIRLLLQRDQQDNGTPISG